MTNEEKMIRAVEDYARIAGERYTKYLRMYLPGENNFYRVEEDQNQNFEKIDGALEQQNKLLMTAVGKLGTKQDKTDDGLQTIDKTVVGAINEVNIRRVDTIEDLKKANVKLGDVVEVLGYYSKDDGATHKRVISGADDGSGIELDNGLWGNVLEKKSELTFARNYVKDEELKPLSVNILGDSISNGAKATNYGWDSWVALLKMDFMRKYHSTNTGLEPFYWESENNVSWMAGIKGWENSTEGVFGSCKTSNVDGAEFVYKTRMFGAYFGLAFNFENNGKAKIYVNDVFIKTIDRTSGVRRNSYNFFNFLLNLNNDNYCEIKIVADKGMKLYGWSQHYGQNDPCVNNMSISGRRLANLDLDCVDDIVDCSTLLMALNHNDAGDFETDETYRNKYKANLNLIIKKCKENNTELILVDFMWLKEKNQGLRAYLKFLSLSQKIKLIETPNLFKSDGSILTFEEMLHKYKLFGDTSHPTDKGHEVVYSIISKEIGLNEQGNKLNAICNDPRKFYFVLNNEVFTKYKEGTHSFLSYYTMNGTEMGVKLSMTFKPLGTLKGSYKVVDLNSATLPNHKVLLEGETTGKEGIWNTREGANRETIMFIPKFEWGIVGLDVIGGEFSGYIGHWGFMRLKPISLRREYVNITRR